MTRSSKVFIFSVILIFLNNLHEIIVNITIYYVLNIERIDCMYISYLYYITLHYIIFRAVKND